METLATATYLLPEQTWDAPDTADGRLKNGRPTGSAVPLAWAHAEYIKLLRSVRDGKVFDLIPEVANRYLAPRRPGPYVEFWSFACQTTYVDPGSTLRVIANAKFQLRFSLDGGSSWNDEESRPTELSVDYVDVQLPGEKSGACVFTFFWRDADRWEGSDFSVRFGA